MGKLHPIREKLTKKFYLSLPEGVYLTSTATIIILLGFCLLLPALSFAEDGIVLLDDNPKKFNNAESFYKYIAKCIKLDPNIENVLNILTWSNIERYYIKDIGWFMIVEIDCRNKQHINGIRGKGGNGHFVVVKINPEQNKYTLIGSFSGNRYKIENGEEITISSYWYSGIGRSGESIVYKWDGKVFKQEP